MTITLLIGGIDMLIDLLLSHLLSKTSIETGSISSEPSPNVTKTTLIPFFLLPFHLIG